MKVTVIPPIKKEKKRIRVAAYARVSSGKDAAFHSLEAQMDYYENYVKNHENWDFVGVYADKGISGTTMNRPEFQRMLKDCRDGKVDLVITKSITRFARNIVDLLKVTRELSDHDIDCYFEKEHLHSISPDGELLLSLLAIYAEEEARSASENTRWRVQKKFEKGESWHVFRMYGYETVGEEIRVVPEQAEVVKRIYREYLEGKSLNDIAKNLTKDQIPAPAGEIWPQSTVERILKDPCYTGTLVLQKSYCNDFRTKKMKKNRGELKKYVVYDNHPSVIDEETFELVQEELRRRFVGGRRDPDIYPFIGQIICGSCGRKFSYNYYKSGNFLSCSKQRKYGKKVCPAPIIHEKDLMDEVKEILSIPEDVQLTRKMLQEKLNFITAYPDRKLVFNLKSGKKVTTFLKEHERNWKPEYNEALVERNRARAKKKRDEKKGGEMNE